MWNFRDLTSGMTSLNKYLLMVVTHILQQETYAGRKFRAFADFWPIRESLFREIFRTEASVKVYSREIRESRVIYDEASKID